MSRWLEDELSAAVAAVRLEHFIRLNDCGVRASAIAQLGTRQAPFGVARVRKSGRDTFEPDPNGVAALILPVLEANRHSGEPDIIDLLAFRTCEPNRVMCRTGEGWALGLGELYEERPLPIVGDPLKWLDYAGEALFIFNWDVSLHRWRDLHACPAFLTDTPSIADRLRQRLLACAACPLVHVDALV